MVGKRSGSGCRDIGLNYLHDLKMLIGVWHLLYSCRAGLMAPCLQHSVFPGLLLDGYATRYEHYPKENVLP